MLFTRWFGATVAYSLYALPAVLGLVVQWRRYPEMRSLWHELSDKQTGLSADEAKALYSQRAVLLDAVELEMYWVAVVLLLVPGVISHVIALVLVVPPTRRWLIGQMSGHIERARRPSAE